MGSAVICGSRVVGSSVGFAVGSGSFSVGSVAGRMVVVGLARVRDVGHVSGVRVVHVVVYGLDVVWCYP